MNTKSSIILQCICIFLNLRLINILLFIIIRLMCTILRIVKHRYKQIIEKNGEAYFAQPPHIGVLIFVSFTISPASHCILM